MSLPSIVESSFIMVVLGVLFVVMANRSSEYEMHMDVLKSCAKVFDEVRTRSGAEVFFLWFFKPANYVRNSCK